jgi:erythritol transport system ATP-binding protein
VIRDLTQHGVAIVYISHHLEEAIEIADYAVVFRDGDLVATEDAANIDLSWVVRQMVGREADYDFRDEPRDYGDVALSIEGVTVAELDTGRISVNNVSLDVRQGEIVCLYGLMGAGRTELMEALAGRDPLSGGRVLLDGVDIAGRTIAERIELGLGLVPEDRQRDGLVQMMSVGSNLSLPSLLSNVRNQFISRRAEREKVRRQIEDVRVKAAGPDALITSLSGGNQQKVVIGKILLTDPKVILLDEPTRGIDVGAKGEIFALLFREARRGLAVLYVTSEIGEALTASHRIVVMSKGRIVREFDPRTATRDEIMAASGEHDADDDPADQSVHRPNGEVQ